MPEGRAQRECRNLGCPAWMLRRLSGWMCPAAWKRTCMVLIRIRGWWKKIRNGPDPYACPDPRILFRISLAGLLSKTRTAVPINR